ncbi:hypothetical protein H4S02_002511 [Coemansia sp. RSA 2611]|nr:hypothetical protein H4S02_002511 [Coemansia sp. RSA 2611]
MAALDATGGTLNLAHSLMRSRVAWLSNAFDRVDDASASQPRDPLGAAEIQIGPHLFPATRFHRISALPAKPTPGSVDRSLALEFADNPNSLFWLPPDLGIDRTRDHDYVMHFFAQPRKPAADRKPSVIKQEWPHYYLAEKTLTRINIVVHAPAKALADALAQYADMPSVRLCREYRQTVCQPQPTVKYWYAFLSEPQLDALDLPTHALKSPAYPPPPPATPMRSRPAPRIEQRREVLRTPMPVCRGGGKAGYNVRVAAAHFKRRAGPGSDTDGPDEPDGQPAAPKRRRVAAASPERSCTHCGCGSTPIWRRGPAGTGTLCNACGVKWKVGRDVK